MSSAVSSWRAPGAGGRPVVVVASAAALVALGLGGHGLLVPAGPSATLIRVAGALVALAGVGVLLRLDGPTMAARTLMLVTVAGALTALATLPMSPVTLSDASPGPGADGAAGRADEGTGTVVLERVKPDVAPLPDAGTLVLPDGAAVALDGDQVILQLPGGGASVLGRATNPGGAPPPAAPATGQHPAVVVVDGVIGRSDGGPLGGDTALGGVTLEGPSGRRVVVGDGVLLEVPDPIPADPPNPLSGGADAVLAALLAAFALLAFAPPVVRFADRVRTPAVTPEPPPARSPSGDAGQVEEGLAEVLRSMLADPDPRTAIIGVYARLLAALAQVGFARRDEETPHEHLWRVLGPLGVRPAPVHRLAELFVQARFTPRPLTDRHRDAAIGALADAVADLRLSAADVATVAGRLETAR